jgi:hypothetical protein
MIETKENKERWENFFVIKLYIFKRILLNYKKNAAAADMVITAKSCKIFLLKKVLQA